MVLDGVDMKTAQVRLAHSDPRLALASYAKRRVKATGREGRDSNPRPQRPERLWDGGDRSGADSGGWSQRSLTCRDRSGWRRARDERGMLSAS